MIDSHYPKNKKQILISRSARIGRVWPPTSPTCTHHVPKKCCRGISTALKATYGNVGGKKNFPLRRAFFHLKDHFHGNATNHRIGRKGLMLRTSPVDWKSDSDTAILVYQDF